MSGFPGRPHRMLNNRACIGEAVHKSECYPDEHAAIIDRETWDCIHAILQESPRTRAETPALRRGPAPGPIRDADRGSRCCSNDYPAMLKAHSIIISMSGMGNCFDNAKVSRRENSPHRTVF